MLVYLSAVCEKSVCEEGWGGLNVWDFPAVYCSNKNPVNGYPLFLGERRGGMLERMAVIGTSRLHIYIRLNVGW